MGRKKPSEKELLKHIEQIPEQSTMQILQALVESETIPGISRVCRSDHQLYLDESFGALVNSRDASHIPALRNLAENTQNSALAFILRALATRIRRRSRAA